MMHPYCVVSVLNDSLVTIENYAYGCQMWTRVKLRTRKTCIQCHQDIEYGWRPLTNKNNRMHRLCDLCATRSRDV